MKEEDHFVNGNKKVSKSELIERLDRKGAYFENPQIRLV